MATTKKGTQAEASDRKERVAQIAAKYGLEIVYSFGSRAKEVLEFLGGTRRGLRKSDSDADLGVLAGKPLDVQARVQLADELESLLGLPRVDVVLLNEASPALAADIVSGELVFAADPLREAEYQLYVLRRAGDLLPLQREWEKSVLGF